MCTHSTAAETIGPMQRPLCFLNSKCPSHELSSPACLQALKAPRASLPLVFTVSVPTPSAIRAALGDPLVT